MYALLYMQALGDPAQAFCNFLLFCVFDETVRINMLKKMLCRNRETYDKTPDDREELLLQHSGSYDINNSYGSTQHQSKRDSIESDAV